MVLVCIATLVFLLFAAIGHSWWWRGVPGQPVAGRAWYGNAAFCWGVFFLALYVTWPTVMAILHLGSGR